MMGSKRKIKSIFDALSNDGIDKIFFDKVHTPIGIEIEAETPEEIAISIAAEIIKVKNS
jgi:xanthine dehydrogenase accessory factor